MPTQPFSLQDAIAAWLTNTQAGPSPASAPEPTPDFRTVTTPADGLVDMAQPSQPKVDWRALALAAQGTVKAQASLNAAAEMQRLAQPTPWQNMGLRIAGGVGGGIVGSVGGPVGAAAGAALGSALMSNEVVQPREVQQGTREGVNPLVGYAEGVAALPSEPSAMAGQALLPQLPRIMAGNWALGGAGDSLVQLAETGTVDLGRSLQAANQSALIGGGIAGGLRVAQRVPGAVRAVADSPAVQRMMADETGAVGPRASVPEDVAFAKAKALYLERGAGQSPVRMTQALRDSGYRDASHGVVARLISEAEGTPFTPTPRPMPRRQPYGKDYRNPFHFYDPPPAGAATFDEIRTRLAEKKAREDRIRAAVEASRVEATAPAPSGRAGALARLFSDETGAVGKNDPLKWNVEVKPATRKNLEGAFRQAPSPIKTAVRELLGSETPDFDALLTAAKTGDEAAVKALGLLRLDPTKTPAAKTKAPTRVVTPVSQTDLPLTPGVEPVPTAPGTYVEQRPSGTRTVTIGDAAPPAAALTADSPAATVDSPAAPRPRQPYVPERPLDPLNLPETVEARRDPTPAWIAEDKERSYRYNTEILGMDEVAARQDAEATATPEAIARRRNIMPISEMDARSNRINAMDLLTEKPKVLTAEQQRALADTQRAARDQVRNINERIGGSLDDLRASVVAGDADAIARMQSLAGELGVQGIDGIERARLEAATLSARLQLFGKATRSEWGRAGRAMQVEAKSRNLTDQQFLEKAYEMGAPPSAAIEALDRLRGNPAAQRQYLEDLFKPSGQQMWKAYLYNNMLSGVPTLGVNIESNLVRYVQSEAAKFQAAGLERALGGERQVAVPPPQLLAKSYADGMRHAGKAFLSAMWDGRTPLDDTIAVNTGEVFKGHWLATALEKSGVGKELSDRLGRMAVNKWKRILVGTDAAFQMMAIYPESYRRATAEALNKGLKGKALADAVLERVRAFDYHADADKAVRDYARRVTFAGDMGEIGKGFQYFVNKIDGGTVRIADKMHAVRTGQKVGDDFKSGSKYGFVQFPFGTLHFPFVRIGAQLWSQSVGLLTDMPRAGVNLLTKQGDSAENLQRLVESANAYMLMGTFAGLYGAGVIDFTTRPPENDFEREQFYNVEGKLPWAIGINGRYYSMASLGPLGDALAPLAAYLKGVGSDDDATRAQRFSEATAAIAKMKLDSTLVRTAMQTFEGLTNEDKQGRLVGNYVAPLIPEGSFLRNARDVTDTTLRDPKTFGDEVKALLPGLSTTVDPRLNAWGADIQKQPVMKRVLGSAPQTEDFVGQELLALKESLPDLGRMDEGVYPADLKVSASSFEKTLEQMVNKGVTNAADGVKVRFTEQEKQQYMRLVGTATQEALAAVIAPDNPEWTALTPQEKRAMVKSLKDLGQEIGKELFLEVWLGDDPQ